MQPAAPNPVELLRLSPETFPIKEGTDDSGPLSAPSLAREYLTPIFEIFLRELLPSQGFLLLDESGQLVQGTSKARRLCNSLQESSAPEDSPSASLPPPALPRQVMHLYELLLDSRIEFPGQPLQMFEEVLLDNGQQISLNAEWIDLGGSLSQCLLVKLEDVSQTMTQRARCDACRYNLTRRETEVWALHMQGLSYREIGRQLFITMSTVRKHMKSIHSKRRGDLL